LSGQHFYSLINDHTSLKNKVLELGARGQKFSLQRTEVKRGSLAQGLDQSLYPIMVLTEHCSAPESVPSLLCNPRMA